MSIWFYPNLLWFYRNADLIITLTEYSKKTIDSYGTKVPTIAISNGINREEYQYKEENVSAFKEYFNIKERQKVVIGIGFYFQRKGIHVFFEVARTMPEVTFIWFGYLAPILTTNFIKKAIKHKPDNVILPGYIAGSIMQGALHYTDCLFFPSYEETEGIVVLEALACNKPVHLRDIGVYEGWTEDGVNCNKAKTNEEFKEKLLYILNNDCSDIVRNGQKLIDSRTLSVVGKELKAVYSDLIEQFKNKHN